MQTNVAEVLAAVIPCSRLYGYLGCTLAVAHAGSPRHTYSDWVDTYSSREYLVSDMVMCNIACRDLTRVLQQPPRYTVTDSTTLWWVI